jgi:Flp pilus assembly pilin Flp
MNSLLGFLKDERGQDIVEYTLLMSFLSLATAALFVEQGGTVNGIWNATSHQLSNAVIAAS